MQRKTVVLAGREYTVNELPARRNMEWRKLVETQVVEIAGFIERAPQTELTDGAAVSSLVRELGRLVLGSVDIVVELLFAYAPELAKDRKRIEDEAFESELVQAFLEVLQLGYPFFSLARSMLRIADGLTRDTTMTSSASVNGESGATSLTELPSTS